MTSQQDHMPAQLSDLERVVPEPQKLKVPAAIPEPQKKSEAPRLEALDGPRYLASLNIICFHAYGYRGHIEAHLGGLWTQFFFVLAGFVLAYVEMARPQGKAAQQLTTWQYIRKRLITIYPLYLVSLLFFVLETTQIERSSSDAAAMCKWGTLPLHIFLLQAIVQVPCAAPYSFWNGVSWFLSALVVYWALLRPLSRYFRGVSLVACCFWLLALWLASLLLVPLVYVWNDGNGGNTWLSHGPLGYIHVFVAGIVTARIFILSCTKDIATDQAPAADFKKLSLATDRAPWALRWGCVTGYVLYGILFATWWHLGHRGYIYLEIAHAPTGSWEKFAYLVLHNGGILPIMVLILAGGAAGVDPIARAFRGPFFQALARISYSQYILQGPVEAALLQTGMSLTIFKCVYFPVLLGTAYAFQRFVEAPFTDMQRQSQVAK